SRHAKSPVGIAYLTRKIRKGAIVAPQIHSHPKIVNIVRSKHIDLALSLRRFNDNTDRKILPGNAEESFTPLPNPGAHRTHQLGESVPIRHASFSAAVTSAFLSHALDIAESVSTALRQQGRPHR